jgi:hypothetical protein
VKEIDKSVNDSNPNERSIWIPGNYTYKSTKTFKNGETVTTETINGKTTVTTVSADGPVTKKSI